MHLKANNKFYEDIYSGDLELVSPCRMGDSGRETRLVQEWLCLQGIGVVIDGRFGPATDKAVRNFQNIKGIREDGIVESNTYMELVRPMTHALRFNAAADDNLSNIIVKCAEAHLAQHPRETGGQNKGPWVRLYMDGYEGLPWCAGFVCFILKQAAFIIDRDPPFGLSFSCDILAKNAELKNLLLRNPDNTGRSKIKPGSLFLIRKSASDWIHTGIVSKIEYDSFYSIEGNSNGKGDIDGYEVCRRIRGFDNKDFILSRIP